MNERMLWLADATRGAACAHFAPWPKGLMKQMVSGAFYQTLGAKMRKWAHFTHFGLPQWKMLSVSNFYDSISPNTLKSLLFHF